MDRDLRPWEQPGALRRDCEPHRGEFLRGLSRWATGLSCVAIFCFFPIVVALPMALFVLIFGRRDLAEMQAGRMDSAGMVETRAAIREAVYTIFTILFALVFWAGLIVFGPSNR